MLALLFNQVPAEISNPFLILAPTSFTYFQTLPPGDNELNFYGGCVSIAPGKSSVKIKNFLVTADSNVFPTLKTIDATLTEILNVVPSDGFYTIHGNAAATGTVVVGILIQVPTGFQH